ncbi:hypothetical protein HPB48_022337 [Haemaphysalis longicornis]|uniref:NodB homology domain-containing protein n=1 Tax=Haemaphysalis longicornis TaxID=44386 RepID=A0A9J6FMZ3_HAELO|nr:hypothetical protein HPB48_022337 [Haemaphysalis longicornis]
MPQFVMLTFDDAVNKVNMAFYRELLNNPKRKNTRNGCSIAATFFVSAEYLDYEAVNQLHSWGNEIALHSISHRTDSSYWQTINSTQWEREVMDERSMLTAFANVPASDVIGFRGPFLFTGGDQGFSMLHKNLRWVNLEKIALTERSCLALLSGLIAVQGDDQLPLHVHSIAHDMMCTSALVLSHITSYYLPVQHFSRSRKHCHWSEISTLVTSVSVSLFS